MKTHLYKTLVALIAALIMAPSFAMAEKKVVAKVGDAEITEEDIRLAGLEVARELASFPEQQKRVVLLEFLIQRKLFAALGTKKEINGSDEFKKRVAYYNNKILHELYVEKFIRSKVTEASAKQAFEAEIKKNPPQKERRASHILVKTEKEAKDIVAQLKKGADFAKLAKEKSTGPSKVRGGDLGYFARGRMVPAFDKAVFSMKKGEVSAPVKTQFGWHVIKLVDERMTPLPTFDQVKVRFMQHLMQQKEQEEAQKMRTSAKVEIFDKKLDAMINAPRGSFSGDQSKKK